MVVTSQNSGTNTYMDSISIKSDIVDVKSKEKVKENVKLVLEIKKD